MPFVSILPESSAFPVERRRGDAARDTEFHFDWWHGDDLVAAFPHHLVTSRLRRSLARIPGATGFTTEPASSRRSPFFRSGDSKRLPRFWRLVLSGQPGVDDISATTDNTLVVSARILVVLLSHTLEQASFQKFG